MGTLLMPAFAVFFPVNVAVALTAIVHFLNNLFKLFLLGKQAHVQTVLRFGIPAILAAMLGAGVLTLLSDLRPLFIYELAGREMAVTPLNFVIALLMVLFALFDVIPALEHLQFDRKFLALGGALSGFFGGLSGHQGALRAAFLIRCGLSKQSYIATGIVIACLVDMTRLSVYATHFTRAGLHEHLPLLMAATAAAFLGAFIGSRLVTKVTLRTVQVIVSVLLLAIAVALGSGLI